MPAGLSATDYHERTKHSPRSVREGGHRLDFDNKPRPFKDYESLSVLPLADSLRPSPIPALAAIAAQDPSPDQASSVDFDALTQLGYFSSGITRRIRRRDRELLFRAAACTGALYHLDLYFVSGPIGDLASGVYHFDPRTLSLDVLREGDYRATISDATAGHPAVENAEVSIVLTSTWWRNAWKYRNRTYRHAFWDGGTVIANLLSVARSLGLPATTITGFVDSAIADLVGVEPAHEAPIAILPVGSGGDPSPVDQVSPIEPETKPLSATEIDYPLIREAYAASTLPDAPEVADWRAGWPASVGTRTGGDGERVDLDPVDPNRASKVPLYKAIRRRGSCREYRRDTLNFRKVSTVLDRAVRSVGLDVGTLEGRTLRFNDIYCIVSGVETVDPGAYQLHPESGTLERLHGGEYRDEAGHLALDQRLGADAAISVYFMTDLAAVTDRVGDRGYRPAQLEAAITAGRLYLGTYAHRNLGATGLTFYDDRVTEFFSPRASGQTPTFLWTLGRPA